MGQERMVVLANSRKHGGCCMAGKVLSAQGFVGGWVRPVIGAAADGLPLSRAVYGDGRHVSVLDVVEPELGPSVPALHQSENRLMGPAVLRRCGRITWNALPNLTDRSSAGLWLNGYSSGCGCNDRVPVNNLYSLSGSLMLCSARDLVLQRVVGFEGQLKYRAQFRFGIDQYNLALTDPVAISWFGKKPLLLLPDAYVCVSLAVPFHDGFAYKLAASVITKERAG